MCPLFLQGLCLSPARGLTNLFSTPIAIPIFLQSTSALYLCMDWCPSLSSEESFSKNPWCSAAHVIAQVGSFLFDCCHFILSFELACSPYLRVSLVPIFLYCFPLPPDSVHCDVLRISGAVYLGNFLLILRPFVPPNLAKWTLSFLHRFHTGWVHPWCGVYLGCQELSDKVPFTQKYELADAVAIDRKVLRYPCKIPAICI